MARGPNVVRAYVCGGCGATAAIIVDANWHKGYSPEGYDCPKCKRPLTRDPNVADSPIEEPRISVVKR